MEDHTQEVALAFAKNTEDLNTLSLQDGSALPLDEASRSMLAAARLADDALSMLFGYRPDPTHVDMYYLTALRNLSFGRPMGTRLLLWGQPMAMGRSLVIAEYNRLRCAINHCVEQERSWIDSNKAQPLMTPEQERSLLLAFKPRLARTD
jgi:hypothetical protein